MRARARALTAVVALVALVLALAPGCGSSGEAPHTLRLGYLPNITNAAALVGMNEGIFDRDLAGTRVSTEKFATGTEATAALLAGSLDAAYLGMGPVITAQSRAPGRLRVVAGAGEAGALLVVRRGAGIRSVADLRGRDVGFPGYGNTQDMSLAWELAQVGLSGGRDADVHTVRVRNADLQTAFERGALDAALAPEPWGSALVDKRLATVLVPADRVMGDGRYPSTVLVVRSDFADRHPGLVRELVRANREAVEAAHDPAKVAEGFLAVAKSKVPEAVLMRGIASNHPTTEVWPDGTRKLVEAATAQGYLRDPVEVRALLPHGR